MPKKKYDLIFSLGGSCAAAYQLKVRNMRVASLPFDWLFCVDNSALINLIKCFEEDFQGWFLKENLKELKDEEKGESPLYQYKDIATGYRFIHDFHKALDENGEYEKNKSKYARRIGRLYKYLDKAQKICLLFDSNFKSDIDLFRRLQKVLEEKFGKKDLIDFVICEFESDKCENIIEDNISVYRYLHKKDYYMYSTKTFEFKFLDDMCLSSKLNSIFSNFLLVKKIKKGFSLNIIGIMPTIFRIRVYLFGFRIDFCIGKVKD